MRLVRGPAFRSGSFFADSAATPFAVLSEPRPWTIPETKFADDEGDEEGEWDRANALASRAFCASTSCSRNVFCRSLKDWWLSGSISASEGVRCGSRDAAALPLKARAMRRGVDTPTPRSARLASIAVVARGEGKG